MGGGVVYLQNCIKLLRFHASSWFCRPVSQESRRSQWIRPLGFYRADSILIPLFDLRWSCRAWPPRLSYLWRSKNKIIENRLCEVSNHRFFGALILFWYPFWMHKKFIFIDFIFWPPEVSKFWRLAKNMKTCPINLK